MNIENLKEAVALLEVERLKTTEGMQADQMLSDVIKLVNALINNQVEGR